MATNGFAYLRQRPRTGLVVRRLLPAAGGMLLAAVVVVGVVLALAPATAQRASSGGSGDVFARLPWPAKALISQTLGRDDRAFRAVPSVTGFGVRNARQHLAARFSRGGVFVHSGSARLGLELRAEGYGNRLRALGPAPPRAERNRVSYRRGSLEEWYANGPLGLEQGFTLRAPPAGRGAGPLTLAMGLSGNLDASLDRGGAGLTLAPKAGRPALRYTGLSASDARGHALPAWLELRGQRLLLRVDDGGARYPLKVDPFVQQAKLTASDGTTGEFLGRSVATAGDTIVAGAPWASGQGAVYVFVKPASGWASATETAKLTASDSASGDTFGGSVAINGDTIVAGAANATVGANSFQGAAYVFVKPASGWASATETAKLTASDGAFGDALGASVAVSGDTVVAGAPFATLGPNLAQGAAYVFVKPASGWANATETAKLTASDGATFSGLGGSVAIAGDTAVAGAAGANVGGNSFQGAAYVFVKPSSGWASATETAKLTASDGAGGDSLGVSVAVAGDTVVAGALNATVGANPQQGTAYVFVKPAGGWTNATETAKLTASDGAASDLLGFFVAVAGDTVVAGAPGVSGQRGAAYVFVKPASGWASATETAKLTASDGGGGDSLGVSVAVAGDTVVAGAPFATVGANLQQGAAYVFGTSGADLSITKSDSPDPVISGNQLTYTITVTNNGPQDATGVSVTDPLPADVHFNSMFSSRGTCTRSSATKQSPKDGKVTCSLGGVSNGASATITIVVTATKPETLTNTASVSGDQTDPVPGNNSATATTTVVE